MKLFKLSWMAIGLALLSLMSAGCGDDKTTNTFTTLSQEDKTVTYSQVDQMGRPGINTVLVEADSAPSRSKDNFNTSVPSNQGSSGDNFEEEVEENLKDIQGIGTDTGTNSSLSGISNATLYPNAAGISHPDAFSQVLIPDVLNVNTSVDTAFFTTTNGLNGRNLDDDVISGIFTLLFGGSAGSNNSSLTNQNISGGNDKNFLTVFPYLAAPH